MKFLPALFLLIFTLSLSISADDDAAIVVEEPAEFLDAVLGSEDVLLFLTGSWKADISASTGFGWSEAGGFSFDSAYSGMETGFTFSQTPDFTATLSVYERFLFEAAFSGELDDATFRLGYQGKENEFLSAVSAGNMGINLSDAAEDSDFFYIPDGGPSSFGFYAAFSGDSSEHELLLRFDPDKEQTKVYIGSDAVTEIELEASAYLRERFFYVPNLPADPVFYTECPEADGTLTDSSGRRSFRPLASGDYSYSPPTGLLYLKAAPEGMLLAGSDSFEWSSVVSIYGQADGQLSDYRLTTSEGGMLILSEKGSFSPFESAAAYSTGTVLPEDSYKTRVYLAADASSVSSAAELSAARMPKEGIIILRPAGSGSAMYPLDGFTSGLSSVYGTDSLNESGVNYLKVIVIIRETESSYSIDDPIPGTVRVFINGTESLDWELNGDIIEFGSEPNDGDRIEIRYRKKNSGEVGGDLLFASANRFDLGAGFDGLFNTGFRWNIFSGAFADPGEENPGFFTAEGGFGYDNGGDGSSVAIKAGIKAGLKLDSVNSAGILRMKNMSGGSLGLTLNRNTVFPAAPSGLAGGGLAAADRGILLYKDYRIESGASSFLQNYNADIAAGNIYSPVDSTAGARYKAGPYTAAAGQDGKSGEILVMDYILPGSGSWTGVQIPISKGSENVDLRGYNSISFDCKSEGDLSDIVFYVEVGQVSEDLDADGILDAETGKYSSGYVFNDPNAPGGTLIGGDSSGGGNDLLDTEDINGSGFIDIENADAVAVFSSGSSDPALDPNLSIPGSSWKRVRLYFDSTAASAAAKLGSSSFVRITAVNGSAAEKTGRLMIDDLRLEGRSFYADDSAGLSRPDFSEVKESLIGSADDPASVLIYPYREASEDNEVMRVEWDDAPWNLYSVISPVEYDDYESIVFYIHAPSLDYPAGTSPRLSFSMLDPGGSGIKAEIPLSETTDWQKIELKPGTAQVLVNDSKAAGALLSVDQSAGSLVRLEIGIDDVPDGESVIYFDEIYLKNPALDSTAEIRAEFSMKTEDALLKAGDFSIIGVTEFEQRASYTASLDDQEVSDLDLYTGLSTELLGLSTKADLSWTDITGTGRVAASHELKLPLLGGSLILTDTFRTDNAAGGDFSSSDSIDISAGPVTGKIAGFSSSLESGLLTRQWSSNLSGSFSPFTIGADGRMLLSGTGFTGGWDNYFGGWTSAVLLAGNFESSSPVERKTELSLTPALETTPVGADFDLKLSAGTAEGKAFNMIDLKLGIPVNISLDTGDLAFELGYERNAAYYDSAAVPSGFAEDLGSLFSNIRRGIICTPQFPSMRSSDRICLRPSPPTVRQPASARPNSKTASFLPCRGITQAKYSTSSCPTPSNSSLDAISRGIIPSPRTSSS